MSEEDEMLREAACNGDVDQVEKLINHGVNVNSQNCINGMTALHWACKRGHRAVVQRLLQLGADRSLLTMKGETCLKLTNDLLITSVLGGDVSETPTTVIDLPIVPNYLANPVFTYATPGPSNVHNDIMCMSTKTSVASANHPGLLARHTSSVTHDDISNVSELVLKVRVAGGIHQDFIEVEVPRVSLTFDSLLIVICHELDVDQSQVHRVRKLPDVTLRGRDAEVRRLRDYDALELIMYGDRLHRDSVTDRLDRDSVTDRLDRDSVTDRLDRDSVTDRLHEDSATDRLHEDSVTETSTIDTAKQK